MVETVQHPALGPLRVLGIPVKLSETPGHVTSPPPTFGQHTRAVLEQDLRLTATEIEKLAKAGAVRM
jgi:crotonobetainyl-CoA:carnitine CoA-transferase CaiB-like acyl-CoA transferase